MKKAAERTFLTAVGRMRTVIGRYVAIGGRADLAGVEASSTSAIGELSSILNGLAPDRAAAEPANLFAAC